MVKIMMSAGMLNKLISYFDGYEDEKIKCTLDSKKGIKAIFNCETEMNAEEAASYCKSLFKKSSPEAAALYFSIQPEGKF